MSKEIIQDFTNGSVFKKLIRFSMPLFLANLLQIVYSMVDMLVVGHVIGSAGLSAVTIGGEITNFFTMFVMGFCNAGQVIISQYVGAAKREHIGKFIGTLASFLFICAVVLSTAAIVFRVQILTLMNTPPEAFENALSYMVTTMAGLIFIFGYNTVSAVLRGLGDSVRPFIFIAISAVLNLVLDIVFVVFLHMEAFGAALATVIGQSVSFICALIYLINKKKALGFEISKRDFRIQKGYFGTMIKLGIPMAIKQTSIVFSKMFVHSFINSYGVAVSAVSGVGNKIVQVATLVSNSTTTSGSSMVGQNIGAVKYERVPKIMKSLFIINGIFSLLFIAAILLFPTQIFMLFTNDDSIIPIIPSYIIIAVLQFASCAARSPFNSLINGSANYKVNLILAFLDAIILRIGLGLLFGLVFNMGYVGFWLGDAVSGFTPMPLGLVYYWTGKWKTRKYVIKDE